MGTKNNPGEFDCYAKLDPDEPFFVLKSTDQLAAPLVDLWAALAEIRASGSRKVAAARECAAAMRRWRDEQLSPRVDAVHEHCEHYDDWPMADEQTERNGDPGDGLGVQGVCCECGADQEQNEEQDGELQSRAADTPSDAMACGDARSAGNPSSSPLPYDGSTSADAGPHGEPVTADTEGPPRQDEASLPLPRCRCGHGAEAHGVIYVPRGAEPVSGCHRCFSDGPHPDQTWRHEHAPDPRDVRIAEMEAERLQSTARFNRTRREWLRQMADLERTVTELQAANTREVEARREAERKLDKAVKALTTLMDETEGGVAYLKEVLAAIREKEQS